MRIGLDGSAPPRRSRRLWFGLAGFCIAIAAMLAAVIVVVRPTAEPPMVVGLSGGGSLSRPAVKSDKIAFDVSLPPIAEDRFVVLVSWTASGVTWELVATSTDFYVQWSREGAIDLWATAHQIDDRSERHVEIDVSSGVVILVNGQTALARDGGPPAGPISTITVNAVND